MFILCKFPTNETRFILYDKTDFDVKELGLNVEDVQKLEPNKIMSEYDEYPIVNINDLLLKSLRPKERTTTHILAEQGIETLYHLVANKLLIDKKVSKLSSSQRKLVVWEEFCKIIPKTVLKKAFVDDLSSIRIVERTGSIDPVCDKNLLSSEEEAEAIRALCQLLQLRDYYNDGWKPDWDEPSVKWCVHFCRNEIVRCTANNFKHLFYFKSEELRDTFLENFRDLLEKVEPLF